MHFHRPDNMGGDSNPNSIRKTRKLLRLSETEYRYLENEEVPESYREDGRQRTDKLDGQVEEKVDLLSERFEVLLEDIDLMASGGFQHTDEWIDAMVSLLDLDLPAHTDHVKSQLEFQVALPGDEVSKPQMFGRQMGQMLWHLFCFGLGETVSEEEIQQNVAVGIIEGLTRKQPIGEAPIFAQEVIEKLQEQARETEKDVKFVMESFDRTPDADLLEEINTNLRHLLESSDLVPPSLLPDRPETDSEKNFVLETYLENKLLKLIEADLSEVQISGLIQEPETLMDEGLTQSRIDRLIREHDLVRQQKLVNTLQEDSDRIRDKKGKGVEAVDILGVLGASDTAMSSAEIATEIGAEKWKAGVTGLARDLSGDRREEANRHRDIWNDRPVLSGDKDGWSLTVYGEVLHLHLRRFGRTNDGEVDSEGLDLLSASDVLIPLTGVPEETIEAAVNDVVMPQD